MIKMLSQALHRLYLFFPDKFGYADHLVHVSYKPITPVGRSRSSCDYECFDQERKRQACFRLVDAWILRCSMLSVSLFYSSNGFNGLDACDCKWYIGSSLFFYFVSRLYTRGTFRCVSCCSRICSAICASLGSV